MKFCNYIDIYPRYLGGNRWVVRNYLVAASGNCQAAKGSSPAMAWQGVVLAEINTFFEETGYLLSTWQCISCKL